jgi:hypothetical protein
MSVRIDSIYKNPTVWYRLAVCSVDESHCNEGGSCTGEWSAAREVLMLTTTKTASNPNLRAIIESILHWSSEGRFPTIGTHLVLTVGEIVISRPLQELFEADQDLPLVVVAPSVRLP